MAFFFDGPPGGGSLDLMQGARALQAAIHDESHQLPPISRSLAQIEQETHALVDAAARAPAATAETYHFLAVHGIDADGLDPATFDFGLEGPYGALAGSAGASAEGADEWEGDVDELLKREHLRILNDAVRRTGEHVNHEYERAYWAEFCSSWQATKSRLLEELCSIPAAPSGPPAVATAVTQSTTNAAAPVRSRTRSPRQLAYGAVLAELLSLRSGSTSPSHMPSGGASAAGFHLLPRLVAAASGGASGALDSATLQLVGIWKLMTAMVETAAPILRPHGGSGAVSVSEGVYCSGSQPLRSALLRGALRSLGTQAQEKLRSDVATAAEEARRGGEPGTEYDAAAALRIEARALDSSDGGLRLTLPGAARDAPLWPLIYWCLRCADFEAALRVARAAPAGSVPPALLALLSYRCEVEAGNNRPSRAVAAAQEEYWRGASTMEPHLRLVYSCLAAPEPQATLNELVPERQRTVEDWLWHKLSMVLAQLSVASDLTSSPRTPGGSAFAVHDALGALQSLLRDYYGEAHFNGAGRTPLLYASVLFHSLQFEHALAFLASIPDLAPEAVHMGLALHHEGLVAVHVPSEDEPKASTADGTFLHTTTAQPRLLLSHLVNRHVSGWANESTTAARAALGYLWLLRLDTPTRLQLASSLLLDSSHAADALAPSPALDFIDPATYRALVSESADRLASRGRVSQAARLLYQAREFTTLASMLADELSNAVAASGAAATDSPSHLRLTDEETPTTTAERAAKLRSDAAAFLTEWNAGDPAAASRHGSALASLIQISQLVDGAIAWREAARRGFAPSATPSSAAASPSLSTLLAELERICEAGLLPSSPAMVEDASAEFRLAPRCIQRAYPALIELSVELLHARYVSLRDSRISTAGGAGSLADLERVRAQAEALLSFGGSALWLAAGVLGQMRMPAQAAQRIAGYLADMT